MHREAIDEFVNKLTITIENKISDYKTFIELQQECLEMLEKFNDKWRSSYEGLRCLGYFRIQVRHLLRNYFNEKKRMKKSFTYLLSVQSSTC